MLIINRLEITKTKTKKKATKKPKDINIPKKDIKTEPSQPTFLKAITKIVKKK